MTTPERAADALFGMPYEQIIGYIRERDRAIATAAVDRAYDAGRADALEEAARTLERLVNRETWPPDYHPVREPDPSTCMVCVAWILKLKEKL